MDISLNFKNIALPLLVLIASFLIYQYLNAISTTEVPETTYSYSYYDQTLGETFDNWTNEEIEDLVELLQEPKSVLRAKKLKWVLEKLEDPDLANEVKDKIREILCKHIPRLDICT